MIDGTSPASSQAPPGEPQHPPRLLSLSFLPERSHVDIGSFLSFSDLLRTALTSRQHAVVYRAPITRLALSDTDFQHPEYKHLYARDPAALLSLFKKLPQLTELTVPHTRDVQALIEALTSGVESRIRTLTIGVDALNRRYDAVITLNGRLLSRLMCSRALDMLESLTLSCTGFSHAEAFFDTLKRTPCARLRAINFTDMELSKRDMGMLRAALEARDEKGLSRLSELKLGGDYDVAAAVGHLLRSRACGELKALQAAVDETAVADLATYIMRTRASKLETLDVSGGRHRPHLNSFVRALARPSARLCALKLSSGILAPQSLLMLARAIEQGAWERLETINMFHVDADLDGLAAVMEAMRGGCPRLREMEIIAAPNGSGNEETLDRSGNFGRAIALALAPPGLVALKKLALPETLLAQDADEVTEALACRDTGTSLEVLNLMRAELSSPESLMRAIKSPSCQDLRSLVLAGCHIFHGDLLQQLTEALNSGACRKLEELVLCKMNTGKSLSALASALQRGACPKLRHWELGGSVHRHLHCSKAGIMSILPVLAGRAPCSRHLKKLRLDSCDLNAEDIKVIMAAIASPQGIRLTDLELYFIPMDDEGFMELIKALQGDAGSNLQRLTVSDCGVLERRWDIVAALLEAGNFPALTEVPPLMRHIRLKAAIDARKRGL